MSETPILRSPQVVAKELDISPATLRRWSDEFTSHLSIGAGATKSGSHRRYTNDDLSLLRVVKELMKNGQTYEQVRHTLNGNHTTEPVAPAPLQELEESPTLIEAKKIEDVSDEDILEEAGERALVTANDEESPAIAFLTNTLTTLSDSQKSLLNSQAANRELLGVVLQDNFNLKEENNRLRERILEVERDVSQNRQEEEWRREALRQELETKISAINQLAMEAMSTARSIETPEIKAIDNKPGCLGMLFSRGSTQIVTVPRRRNKKVQGRRSGPPPPGLSHQQPTTPSQQSSGSHPKPYFPPE